MLRYFVCVTFGILASVSVIIAEDDFADLQSFLMDASRKCMDDYGITEDDFKDKTKEPDFDKFDPCFFACSLKATKLMDTKGMLDKSQANDIATKYIKNNDVVAELKKTLETCSSVNDMKVSDGDKGCDRSLLIFDCFIKNGDSILQNS